MICIGENREAERVAGKHEAVVSHQLAHSVPAECGCAYRRDAYEPVWAIGTGRTPTNDDIAAMHRHIRAELVKRFAKRARRSKFFTVVR